jgi:hypothetical protein
MQTRHERQARNEALLRQVNEQIERLDQPTQEAGLSEDVTFEFLCECGQVKGDDVSCEEHVEMTLAEYEEVRSQDDRFALVPGTKRRSLRKSSTELKSSSSSTRGRKPSSSSRTILAARLPARSYPPLHKAYARPESSPRRRRSAAWAEVSSAFRPGKGRSLAAMRIWLNHASRFA